MSLPCIEVVTVPANEAFIASPKDRSVVQPAFDFLKSNRGLIKIYYGLQTEDPTKVHVYPVWENLQDHLNLQADPVQHAILGKHCKQFMGGAPEVIHIQPLAEPYKALEAPATELAYITVNAGVSKETLETKLDELAKAVNALPESYGAISAVWGPTVEKADTLGLIIGWTSVEAHWNTVKTVPEAIQQLKDIREIATISLTHQLLAPYN
ncbi:uncharacterized protein C8Q71DRAFT_735609 [Rhodofomes roseus]|uniref:ABM domain-containing protein n=1 Tax=Rhodofomes roseus TaxID=34475 RepID=A0ABQ8KW01_9APHY|nr:uncharacterized protein C8Q71DRAFT_735609 [Rhodofomes roseus]KAH9843027.1 hypothetical protein C8Q71DRAFT_735609 [Rhodofomes roseus]